MPADLSLCPGYNPGEYMVAVINVDLPPTYGDLAPASPAPSYKSDMAAVPASPAPSYKSMDVAGKPGVRYPLTP